MAFPYMEVALSLHNRSEMLVTHNEGTVIGDD